MLISGTSPTSSQRPLCVRLLVSHARQDYIDELLANLHHNIELNSIPRVAAKEHPGQRSSPARQVACNATNEVADRRQRRHQQHGALDASENDARSVPAAEASSSARHECTRPPPDRAQQPRGGARLRVGLCRDGVSPPLHPSITTDGRADYTGQAVGGRESSERESLQPLSRVAVRKVDWTAYAASGGGRWASPRVVGAEETGFWWDDRGPETAEEGGQPGALLRFV